MEQLLFAITYAWRNLRRGGSRSVFAAFCVAVGVAAVVGMQLLALNISAAVDKAPKQANGGDIAIDPISRPFLATQIAAVEALRRRGAFDDYTLTFNAGRNGLGVKASFGARTTLIAVRGIEPARYPLYGAFSASIPAVPVRSLLRESRDAVVTRDLYDRLHLRIGATVQLGGPIAESVVIRGIVSTGGLFQGDFGIGGTIYQQLSGFLAADPEVGTGPTHIAADKVYIRTRDNAQTGSALKALRAQLGPFFRYTTADDVARQAATNTANLQKLLLACGLLALLIGGIGIVNTMLVSVGRRTREIAVLKTLGLKGYEVVPLFLMEAVLLGIAGSVLGIAGGIGLSALITELAVQLGAQVDWTLRSSPLGVGLALGIIATAVFGFLPVLRAGHTRPIGVLRDEDAPLPRIGWLITSVVTIFLTGAMGLAAGVVLRNLVLGLALAYGVVLIFLVFSVFFLLVVAVASRGPSFGLIDLRLALRNLTRQKRRVASTLVALFIGMLAVGTVVILAQNVKAELHRVLERNYGFNVIAFGPAAPARESQTLAVIRRLPGLQRFERGILVAGLQILTIDGKPAGQVVDRGRKELRDNLFALRSLDGRDLRVAKLDMHILGGGRVLRPGDEGTRNVVVPGEIAGPLHIHAGSDLRYSVLFGGSFTLHVVGVLDPNSINPSFGGGVIGSASFLRPYSVDSPLARSLIYMQFDTSRTAAAASAINRDLPEVYGLDINSIIPLFDRILDKATVFPVVLAALSLFAGGVIIANTVALAVLERRREIGVMKALGARGSTILRLLLLESGIVGFMGGAMGIAMSMIATLILDNTTLNIATHFDPLVIAGLIGIAVAVALIASVISALPASREKPLIVLRYE